MAKYGMKPIPKIGHLYIYRNPSFNKKIIIVDNVIKCTIPENAWLIYFYFLHNPGKIFCSNISMFEYSYREFLEEDNREL